MDYWEECISEAFEDAGIAASQDQIDTVASWVEGAHDNYGIAHGHDCIPNPLVGEIKDLNAALKRERDKVICSECKGNGRIIINGPVHSSDSDCSNCRGSGYIYY